MKKLFALIIYFFLFVVAVGCGSKRTVVSNDRQRIDSVYIVERPVMVEVPGSVVQTQSINVDSLAAMLRAGIPRSVIEKTLIREDTETGLKVGILIDELGNLTALCQQQDRMIQMMQTEINRLQRIIETSNSETVTKRFPWWIFLVFGIGLAVGILYLAVRVYLRIG